MAGTATTPSIDRKLEELPRSALQFRSEFKFAAADQANAEQPQKVPFTMTARTGDPVDHWYWGRVVHDMAGMTLSKEILPVDYCHNPYEVMGYADKFDPASGDLKVSGAIVTDPDDDDDMATDVVEKQKLGVPYEASIDFSRGVPVIEYVPEFASVEVNGKTFQGPGVIIRKWVLSGLAICPYGADGGTSTEFSGNGDRVGVTTINFPEGGHKMSQTNATPATKQPETQAAPAAAAQLAATPATKQPEQQQPSAAAPAGEAKPQDKFVSAFGDIGARWFLEGKGFESCATEFIGKLKTDHAAQLTAKDAEHTTKLSAVQAELDAHKQKLAALGKGDAGVQFSNADGAAANPAAAKLTQNLGDGLAKFAAGIKLPEAKK